MDFLHTWAVILKKTFGQIVSIRVKTLSNTYLGASGHIKKAKSSLPDYVRHSKTLLLIGSLPDVTTGFPAWERTHKFHSDDVLLPRSGNCFWLVEENFTRGTTNQIHYPDLGSHTSSVRNFHTRLSNVMSRGNRAMSAVFYGYKIPWKNYFEKVALHSPSQEGWARREGLV